MNRDKIVIIKGAGDLASAIAIRLFRAGFSIIMTDIKIPTAVRRTVSFSSCIYSMDGLMKVEDVVAKKALNADEALKIIAENKIAVIVDPNADIVTQLKPIYLIDAIIAKINISTQITDADLVIGIGPGFEAGKDCDCVVETQRGHYLGRVIYSGYAAKNTGIPGTIAGYNVERIIRCLEAGIFEPVVDIKSIVKKGDLVAYVINEEGIKVPIYALINGVVRGLLQPNVLVHKGMKAGDIDPRGIIDYCETVSDKGSAIAGGVLEAICSFKNRR